MADDERKPIVFPDQRPPISFTGERPLVVFPEDEPAQDPETFVPEPEEDLSDAQEQRKQSWVSMVGDDWDINELPREQRKTVVGDYVAPILEGLGPEIGQIYKNTINAVKLEMVENMRFGTVGPGGGYFGPRTMEEKKQLDQQIDVEVEQLLEEIRVGSKKVSDLAPENLSTSQQGTRAALTSIAVVAPGMLASVVLRDPKPAYISMGVMTGADSYTTAREEGLSRKDALEYGAADALIEIVTEILPARAFLKLFPGAKDAAGSFSKQAFRFLIAEMGGEQAATWLQNANAYRFDLDKEMLAIEQAYEHGLIDGLEKEEKIRELKNQRIAVTGIAVVLAGGLMTSVAGMIKAGMPEEEIKEIIRPETRGYQRLTVEEQNQIHEERLDWQEKIAAEVSPQEKIKLALAQTGAALSGAVQTLNELEGQKQALLNDPELKKDTRKLKAAVNKIDDEIVVIQEKVDRIEQTRLEFEKNDERLKRLREIEEELGYSEDLEIIADLEQEHSLILSEMGMEGPQTGAPQFAPVEYAPYNFEEGIIVLENSPEAQKMKSKTGFFNSTVQRLYDELIDPRTGERIVTAYNTIRQKMADSGYTSEGVVDRKAPLLLKEMQKDLRRLLRLSKSLLNKKLNNSRLKNKLTDGTIEETEYNQKVLSNNQAIVEIEANIDKIVERSQEPIIPMRERVEDMNDPYGKKSRFFAPKSLWKTIKETIIPFEFSNTVTYTPALDNEQTKAPQEEEQEEDSPKPLVISFKDIPEDARIRLFFYDASSGTMAPLFDPVTGKMFSAWYDGFEFVNPLSGQINKITGEHALDEMLLPSIELDGKTYQAMWEPGTLSEATVNLWNNPAMDPDKLTLYPKTLGKEDIHKWTAAYHHRFKSFLLPAGPRPMTLAELQSGPGGPIAKGKLSQRQITRLFKDFAVLQGNLAKDIDAGIIKMKAEINNEDILFQGEDDVFLDPTTTMERFKELIAKSFRGNKQAQAQLGALGQTELLEKIVFARKRITKNSKRIIELVQLMDPEGTFYTKEKVQQLEDSVERYMGRIFGAYVFPDWKAPNRLTASKEEKALHAAALEELAAIYAKQKGDPIEIARADAERDLTKLYKGTGEERTKVFVRMFNDPGGKTGINPAYLATDESQTKFIAPQLKQKRTNIPKKVRRALGELNESWAQAQMTAYKQEQFIAMTEYLLDVARIGNSPATRFLSLIPTGRYSQQIVIPGDVISPLNGYWTTPEMVRAIKKTAGYGPLSRYLEGRSLNQPSREIYLAAQTATGWISLAYLTLSLRTQSRNFQSAMLFPLMSGNWETYKNPRAAAQYIKEKISGMTDEELDFVVGEGVTQSSVNIGDRRALFDKMQDSASWPEFFASVEAAEGRKIKKIREAARKVFYVTEEAYLLADDIPKLMNYLGEKESGYKVFAPRGVENLTEQQIEDRIDMISEMMVQMGGQKISRSKNTPAENLDLAIRKRAAFLTRRNIPNYNRLPNIVDMLRVFFLSNFAGFPTAIMVSEANIIKTAMVEGNLALSNDPAMTPGLKRRLGERAFMRGVANIGWAARGAISTTASNAWFAVKGAAVLGIPPAAAIAILPQALGSLVAPWAANHDFIIVSDADEEGVFYVVDVSYSDGYTMVSGPGRLLLKYLSARVFMGEEAASKVWETMVRSLTDLRGTYFDYKIMLGIVQELRTGLDNETGAELWDPNLPVLSWEKIKAKTEHAFNELAPRVVHETIDIFKAGVLTGEEALDKNDQERSILKAIPQALGLNFSPIEPKEVVSRYKIGEFRRRFTDSENFAKNVFRRSEGSELSYDDMPAMVAAYDELQRQHFEQVKDFRLDLHWHAPLMSQQSPEKIIDYIQEKNRDAVIRKRDRDNLFIDRRKEPLYIPTDIDNFVNAYVERLKEAQRAQPDMFTKKEIKRRARTLAQKIKDDSYDKWSKEPVYWTVRGAVNTTRNKRERNLPKDERKPIVFTTED